MIAMSAKKCHSSLGLGPSGFGSTVDGLAAEPALV